MSLCPNKRSPEWIALEKSVGRVEAIRDWLENDHKIRTPEEVTSKLKQRAQPQKSLAGLEQELVDGFLKDFNITVTEYNNMKEDLGLDAYTAADLLTKAIAYQKGQSILPEVAYFAYSMLGKENSKIRSEMRYFIHGWDKYQERYDYHKDTVRNIEGFISNKKEWIDHIRDKVIVDFLTEKIKDYYKNPTEFKKEMDRRWVKSEIDELNKPSTIWEKFIHMIENFLAKFSSKYKGKDYSTKLNNLATSIASEILDKNYTYFDYNLGEEQIRKQYNETIMTDPFAKELVEYGQKLGLVLTGSLALRRAGTVYRTAKENLHDIDWVVPFDQFDSDNNRSILREIESAQGLDKNVAAMIATPMVKELDWYKDILKDYPSMQIFNGFYGNEHDKYETLTVQAVIDGQFRESDGTHEEEVSYNKKNPETKQIEKVTETVTKEHKKGDWIHDTGYMVDFFIRLKPKQEEHENYFKLWKEIMIAKLKMGRAKDMIDWKAFVPYTKSKDSFNFNYKGFRHLNYEDTGGMLHDSKSDPVAYMRASPVQESYKQQAEDIIQQTLGSVYGFKKGDISQTKLNSLNDKLRRLNNSDVPWQFRLSKSGNYYLAGHNFGNVLHSDYFTPNWKSTSYYRPDRNNLMGLAIDDMDKSEVLNNDVTDTDKSNEIVRTMAEALATAIPGIDFQFITPEQAVKFTEGFANPWKDEPSFFVGNTVYFVGPNLRMDMAVHEFSHPLLRAIAKSNPKLFSNLFTKLENTIEGQAIIETVRIDYAKDYPEDSDWFKEECLVRSLTKSAMAIQNDTPKSSGFVKFIKDLLFNIKQTLRRVFGQKVDVSKIDENTNLVDLAKILMGDGVFKIDVDVFKKDKTFDRVAFLREQQQHLNEAETIDEAELKSIIIRWYNTVLKQTDMIKKNRNYSDMADVIGDEYNMGDLRGMSANLSKYAKELTERFSDIQDEIKFNKDRSTAFVNALFRLDDMINKINKHMDEIKNNPDDIGNLHDAYYYKNFIKYWDELAQETQTAFAKNTPKLGASSALSSVVDRIRTNIKHSNAIAVELFSKGGAEIFYKQMEDIAEDVTRGYLELIDDLKSRGASKAIIDAHYKEFRGMDEPEYEVFKALQERHNNGLLTKQEEKRYQELRRESFKGNEITKDKMLAALNSEMEDANPFSSFLEGYLYNPDPIVGGLALYVKNQLNDVLTLNQVKTNAFIQEIGPLLESAGYNPSNVSQLMGKIGYEATEGYVDESGTFVDREIYRFKNLHSGKLDGKDYEHAQRDLQFKIDKAQADYNETGSDEDHIKLLNQVSELQTLKTKYLYQQYVDTFYEREAKLEAVVNAEGVPIGKIALSLLKGVFERISKESEIINSEMDDLDDNLTEKIDDIWRDYRTLHSRYDLNHNLKVGIPLQIAEALIKYREDSSEFYEWKPKEKVFNEKLAKLEQELLDQWSIEPVPGQEFDEWFETMRNKWIERNTNVSIKPEFYIERQRILEGIKDIQDKIKEEYRSRKEGEVRNALKKKGLTDAQIEDQLEEEMLKVIPDVSALYEKMFSITSLFRDQDGETNAANMSPETIAQVRALEDEIIEAKELVSVKTSGLNKKETKRLSTLYDIKKSVGLSQAEEAELRELKAIKSKSGLGAILKKQLNGLYAELSNLQTKEATEYYVDEFNNFLSKIPNLDLVRSKIGDNTITKRDANLALEDDLIDNLKEQSPEFEKWFNENHRRVGRWDEDNKVNYEVWERVGVWSVSRPNDENYLESVKVMNRNGVEETIYRMPKRGKYTSKFVKKEYWTGYNPTTDKVEIVVGEHKDNKGNWLPKDVPGNPFINQEYKAWAASDDPNVKVLEALKKQHLKNQEGLPYKSRLYLDIPRYRKNNLEMLQLKQAQRTLKSATQSHFPFIENIIGRIRLFYKNRQDRFEEGLNFNEELEKDYKLVRADMFGNETATIPITGLYNIPITDTSTDILHSMMKYALSADRQKKLIEISPVARAIQEVVSDEGKGPKNWDSIDRYNYIHRNTVKFLNKEGPYIRKNAVNNFIEREFEGKNNKGMLSDTPWINGLSSLIFKRASFGFFALNIPSALKNALSAQFQSLIMAVGGNDMSIKSWAKGESWAFNAMGHVSFELYNRQTKTFHVQMMDTFDVIEGRYEEKSTQYMSRTLASDTASMSWLYNFRKWTEDQATVQMFAGMMYYKKIMMAGNEINYMDAWEVRDGQMSLKDGIDIRWGNIPTTYTIKQGDTLESLADKWSMTKEDVAKEIGTDLTEGKEVKIDNSKFKRFKNKVQQKLTLANGAYSQFSQPEAGRYLAMRFISFLKRYFTTMFINRWGFRGKVGSASPRMNLGLGELHEGYYVTVLKTMSRIFTTDPKYLAFMTPKEKQAWGKFLFEIAGLIAMTSILAPMLGWDPDDPDRYEKLRQRSGPMPFLGLTAEDPEHPFNTAGFLENHLLNLALQVRAENESFVPWPNYGLDDYTAMLDFKSISTGPTIKAYKEIFTSLLGAATGDPGAYYKKDAGPYIWQQEGSAKFWNQFFKSMGVTGGTTDPVKTIKNAQSIKVRGK